MNNNNKNKVSLLLIIFALIFQSFINLAHAEYKKGSGQMDKKYLNSDALFSRADIQKDVKCYNATEQSGRIFFYIDMIKDIYDDICVTDGIDCDKTKPPIPALLTSISGLEIAAADFEKEVIKNTCDFSPDSKKRSGKK